MKCNMKTMIVAGTALVTTLVGAYAVWPPMHDLILSIGPYFLFLLCPLFMWLMMRSMAAHDDQVSAMTDESSERKSIRGTFGGDRTAGGPDARQSESGMRGGK
nr:DUF2933 domain-containing protein [uncultured Cupriavidus sp.]